MNFCCYIRVSDINWFEITKIKKWGICSAEYLKLSFIVHLPTKIFPRGTVVQNSFSLWVSLLYFFRNIHKVGISGL